MRILLLIFMLFFSGCEKKDHVFLSSYNGKTLQEWNIMTYDDLINELGKPYYEDHVKDYMVWFDINQKIEIKALLNTEDIARGLAQKPIVIQVVITKLNELPSEVTEISLSSSHQDDGKP